MRKIKAPQIIVMIYLAIMLVFITKLNISMTSILNESLIKFGMNSVLVLSLIPMLRCGVGMNFGMSIGVCAGLVGMCVSLEYKMSGISGFVVAIIVAIVVGCLFGYLYSLILNKLKGKEEIIGMFCGYGFVFIMNIFWSIAPFKNRQMLYPIGGQGLRPKIGINEAYGKILDDMMQIKVGNIVIPMGLLLFVAIICILIKIYFNTKTGFTMKVIAENEKFAYLSGVNINKYRTIAIIFSTVIAAVGICVYSQSYGFVQLYDSPLGFSFPAVSAILIGGATRKETSILNAVLGTYLFQTTYLLSVPIANALLMPELSETLRMIITNGIILYAFVCEGGEMGLWKKQKSLS
ncbi:ABC transporter permease [Romboutsia weinsteinii]|uniref:ABC transporter permease n=1 Tax=Romboutsia weinsteinii TaxID=2020949 RepID=A0A371J720_9FIRM|nr:ABC transporter [Romboutsia weinsteinii]RDY28590.1 ABC transporter permease [Romboutsia weinsteinii]